MRSPASHGAYGGVFPAAAGGGYQASGGLAATMSLLGSPGGNVGEVVGLPVQQARFTTCVCGLLTVDGLWLLCRGLGSRHGRLPGSRLGFTACCSRL